MITRRALFIGSAAALAATTLAKALPASEQNKSKIGHLFVQKVVDGPWTDLGIIRDIKLSNYSITISDGVQSMSIPCDPNTRYKLYPFYDVHGTLQADLQPE
jgi:hypothetical protein